MKKPTGSRWFWGGLLISTILLVAHALLFGFVIDDTWISLRYARNLVDGHGLVFNPGEAVEGYSNLLWVLLGAVGLKLGLPGLLWLRLLGTASMVGVLLLVPGAVRGLRVERDPAGAGFFAQGLIAVLGPVACWMLGGLETPLFALLIMAGWRAALARRAVLAGLLGVLLALTRPEGPALGAIFTAWALLPTTVSHQGTRPLRWLGAVVFLVGVGLYLWWRHHTYGYWLPNTYYAKTGDLAGQLRTGWPYGREFLLRYVLPLGGVALVAAVRGGGRVIKSRPSLLTLGVLGFWFSYAVLIGGDSLGMFRFFAPVLPLAAVWTAAVVGGADWTARPRPALLVGLPLAAALLFSSFQGGERRLVDLHMQEANLGGWILAGDVLADQLPAGTTIALGPAGYLPWRTGLRTLDFYGIVTPAIAHKEVAFGHQYSGHEKTDGPWLVRQKPDLIFVGNVDITVGPRPGLIPPLDREVDIVRDRNFQREYEQASLPLGGGKFVNFFRRRADAPR